MDVIEELSDVIYKLNATDEYKNSLTDKLSEQDKKLSDLYHYIESNKLSTAQCYRIVKEIQKQRQLRRKIKQDITIFATYDKHINKMISIDNRNILLTELHKANKRLEAEYQNRIYTEEEIEELLGVK